MSEALILALTVIAAFGSVILATFLAVTIVYGIPELVKYISKKLRRREKWKDVKGFEGLYKISDLGNVYGCKKKANLKPSLNNRGYLHVTLTNRKIRKTLKIHKLVAINFLNHTPCGLEIVVDHINDNPLDNRACNLQLLSSRMNSLKPIRGNSKYRGVSFIKKSQKFKASIYIDGKGVYLGEYKNELDASKAYETALAKLPINKQ